MVTSHCRALHLQCILKTRAQSQGKTLHLTSNSTYLPLKDKAYQSQSPPNVMLITTASGLRFASHSRLSRASGVPRKKKSTATRQLAPDSRAIGKELARFSRGGLQFEVSFPGSAAKDQTVLWAFSWQFLVVLATTQSTQHPNT